ncbi:MAG: type II secretion system F family protein [Syntrophomonadaceae bacterium]|nr:type II secretion system F family protein [Syntrophomonadaceae bacterium]
MLLASIAAFIAIFCFSWIGLNRLFAGKIQLHQRLKDIGKKLNKEQVAGMEDEELQKNLSERIFRPMLDSFSFFTQKYTPIRKYDFTEKRLEYAGRPFDWDAFEFLTMQYIVASLAAILAFIFSAFIYHASVKNQILAPILGFLAGYFLVDLFLRDHITKRQSAITRELPDVLDLMTVSIEAGLGFDSAMQRVVQKSQGVLSAEFSQSLQEMRMGRTRKEALKDLSQRNGVSDLSKFIEAVIQADQLGVSLGNVLRNQSDQMRILRRQRVEEQAMKAPIKMLFPLVIFIFPSIFIVALAPPILRLMDSL